MCVVSVWIDIEIDIEIDKSDRSNTHASTRAHAHHINFFLVIKMHSIFFITWL